MLDEESTGLFVDSQRFLLLAPTRFAQAIAAVASCLCWGEYTVRGGGRVALSPLSVPTANSGTPRSGVQR